MAAMFLTNHDGLNKLWVTNETFLPNFIEIRTVVSDKKIFKKFYIDIQGKQAPPPGGHVF